MKPIHYLLALALFTVLSGTVFAAEVDLHVKEWYPRNNHFVFVCEDDFNASSFDWQYNDGYQLLDVNERNTYHVFEHAGTYTVSCTARDETVTASDSLTVFVDSIRTTEHPPTDPTPNNTLNLHVKQWYPQGNEYVFVCGDGGAGPYTFAYGDGEQLLAYAYHEAFYRYTTPGTYTVECSDGTLTDTLSVTVTASDIGGEEPNATNTTFSEQFTDGDYTQNPAWSQVIGNYGTRLYEIVNGEMHIQRTNAGGSGEGTLLATPVNIPVDNNTAIRFDVKPVSASVANGCGFTCQEHPVNIMLDVERADGSTWQLWYSYNVNTAYDMSWPDGWYENVTIVGEGDLPSNVWLRNQEKVIRDTFPDAVRITKISIGGVGWDYDGWYDNLAVVEKQPVTSLEERFTDGDYTENPVWQDEYANAGTTLFDASSGDLLVRRTGAGGQGRASTIHLETAIPVTADTIVRYDINTIADSLGNGGYYGHEYPVNVMVTVVDSDGYLTDIWQSYSLNGGVNKTINSPGGFYETNETRIIVHTNTPASTWVRDEHYRIQDIVPDATAVVSVRLGGVGWDFEGRYDNIIIYEQPHTLIETFSDNEYEHNPQWETQAAPAGDTLFYATTGELRIARTNSQGISDYSTLNTLTDIPVTDDTEIQFDIKVVSSSVRNGCGDFCTEYPAEVILDVELANGTRRYLHYAYNDDGGLSQDAPTRSTIVAVGNAPTNEWLRNQSYRIRDALPTATRIHGVQLGGFGWDYEGWYDNIRIEDSPAQCSGDQPGCTSTLTLSGGTINNQSLSDHTITVLAGELLTGTATFNYHSTYGSNAVMVFAHTPSWGDHQSSCVFDSNLATPADGTLSAIINTAAPTIPGTYYVLFQYRGEFTAGQVCSMTNWATGSDVWNDGNDMSTWNESTIIQAMNTGNTIATIQHTTGYRLWAVPAQAIRVIVQPNNNTLATASVTVLAPFPIDHNYAFDCAVNSFTPTNYTWNFSDGGTETRTVRDIYHSFNQTGNQTATCTATNGAQTAQGTIIVDVHSPDVSAARTTVLEVEDLGNGDYQFTCTGIGYHIDNPGFYHVIATDVFHDSGPGYDREDLYFNSPKLHFAPNGNYTVTCTPYLSIDAGDVQQLPAYYAEGSTYHNVYCGGWGREECTAPESNSVNFKAAPFDIAVDAELDADIVEERANDNNHVLRCDVSGLYPTSYSWDFGDGSTSEAPVPDVFHTFPTNGTYDVTCSATDGTDTVNAETEVTVTTPVTSSELTAGFYKVLLYANKTSPTTFDLTCYTVGFEENKQPYGVNFFPGSGVTISNKNGEQATATVPGAGNYSVTCSAGVGALDFPYYYSPDPYIYRYADRLCSGGGCTGEGTTVTLMAG
jgi:PKD repeat protein